MAGSGGSAAGAHPLNEGRGVSPGDTAKDPTSGSAVHSAQRRPGREPRRHLTPPSTSHSDDCAQRRPGREPRRHPRSRGAAWSSTTALNEGRGVSPGDTPSRCSSARRAGASPLNEGRGVRPGDTRPAPCGRNHCRRLAQRRPGREPRRHCIACLQHGVCCLRSTKAGA